MLEQSKSPYSLFFTYSKVSWIQLMTHWASLDIYNTYATGDSRPPVPVEAGAELDALFAAETTEAIDKTATIHPYSAIIPRKLFLGQIPRTGKKDLFITCFERDILSHAPLDPTLPRALIISANSMFELAGRGSYHNIITPLSWKEKGVKHHHLPFVDFGRGTEVTLVIDALNEMLNAWHHNVPIYVHCKAGKARSALITCLFMALSDEEFLSSLLLIKKDYIENHHDEEILNSQLKILLNAIEERVKTQRPQVGLGHKINFGVDVLNEIIKHNLLITAEREYPDLTEILVIGIQNRLNSPINQFLQKLSQADSFKELMVHAYTECTPAHKKISYRATCLQELFNLILQDPTQALAALDLLATEDKTQIDLSSLDETVRNCYQHLQNFCDATPMGLSFTRFMSALPLAGHMLSEASLRSADADHYQIRFRLLTNLRQTMRQISADIAQENSRTPAFRGI